MKFLVTGGTGFIGARVVKNLLERHIPVVVADWNADPEVIAQLVRAGADDRDFSHNSGTQGPSPTVEFVMADISDFHQVMSIFQKHPDITHVIHLAYIMGAACEENPHLGVRVNVLGMTNLFEAALWRKLEHLIFTSSETYYGSSHKRFGDRPVTEEDYCGPSDQFLYYGAMKVLNEFMAEKYVKKHGLGIACTRPPIVFGFGRKRSSIQWAEDFATSPALGKKVVLPFPPETRDCWIYVDDCAEQLVRLALKPRISHFAYNNGGHSVTARELAALVRQWLPSAEIEFDNTKPPTPLIDSMDGTRLEREIDFKPRPLIEGIRAHINAARASAGLETV